MSQFRLSAPDQEFNSRVDGLFSCLDEVATQLPVDGLVFESSSSGIRKTTSREHAKVLNDNDGFKRPMECNIPSNKRFKSQINVKNKRPDYVINPEKWTLYEMKDVEELDEAQNKKAALQLFADLKQKTNTDTEKVDLEKDKIVFKKPSHRNIAQNSDSISEIEMDDNGDISAESDNFGGTKKFVMDEYVVGVKKKNKKNKASSKGSVSSSKTKDAVKLSYLKFDDDDDDNDED